MEKKLANDQEAMNSLLTRCELLTVTSGCGALCIFIRMVEGCADFAVHQMGVGGF
jgi:hypothetical protein